MQYPRRMQVKAKTRAQRLPPQSVTWSWSIHSQCRWALSSTFVALSQHTAVAVDVAVGGPYHPFFCSDKDGGPYHPPLWFCHSMAPKHELNLTTSLITYVETKGGPCHPPLWLCHSITAKHALRLIDLLWARWCGSKARTWILTTNLITHAWNRRWAVLSTFETEGGPYHPPFWQCHKLRGGGFKIKRREGGAGGGPSASPRKASHGHDTFSRNVGGPYHPPFGAVSQAAGTLENKKPGGGRGGRAQDACMYVCRSIGKHVCSSNIRVQSIYIYIYIYSFLSFPALPFPSLSFPFLPFPSLSFPFLSFFLSFPFSFPFLSFPFRSFPFLSFPSFPCPKIFFLILIIFFFI